MWQAGPGRSRSRPGSPPGPGHHRRHHPGRV